MDVQIQCSTTLFTVWIKTVQFMLVVLSTRITVICLVLILLLIFHKYNDEPNDKGEKYTSDLKYKMYRCLKTIILTRTFFTRGLDNLFRRPA